MDNDFKKSKISFCLKIMLKWIDNVNIFSINNIFPLHSSNYYTYKKIMQLFIDKLYYTLKFINF